MPRAMVDAIDDALTCGVVVCGDGGRVVQANRTAADLLRLTREQLLGRAPVQPGWRAVDEAGRALRPGDPLAALAHDAPRRFRFAVARTAHQPLAWIRGDSAPFSGAPYRVVCTLVDLTGERDPACAESPSTELRAARRLERLQAVRSAAMAINASHDLRVTLDLIVRQAALHLGVSAAAVGLPVRVLIDRFLTTDRLVRGKECCGMQAAIDPAVLSEARDFLELMERERGHCASGRLAEVEADLRRTGTYRHTAEELEHGARVAWRNNTRCIARFHWQTLQVRDVRHLDDVDEVFAAIVEHVQLSTNDGRIRPLITVFAPCRPGGEGWRIWNPQLIRYAGYRQSDGSVIGDPLNARLTDVLRALGWRGGPGGRFDILPLAIQKPGEAPRLFELPREVVLEVPLSHPDFPWFEELGLRWHALPAISNMRLEIGGVSYSAAPFSGWYMGTEIGARDLSDARRYNLLPVIAERLGLNTRSDRSLWKDRAIVELNVAVLHSFGKHGVAIVDHHTACRQFVFHERKEGELGRVVPAEWSWMVPPISASTTPVFHHPYFPDVTIRPNFFYQPHPWRSSGAGWSGRVGIPRVRAPA